MRAPYLIVPASLALAGAAPAEQEVAVPAIQTLEPLVADIVDAGRLQGRVEARLAVTARSGDASALEAVSPALRSALREALSEQANLYASPFLPVDAGQLADRLTKAAAGVTPEAEAVLILEVSARPA